MMFIYQKSPKVISSPFKKIYLCIWVFVCIYLCTQLYAIVSCHVLILSRKTYRSMTRIEDSNISTYNYCEKFTLKKRQSLQQRVLGKADIHMQMNYTDLYVSSRIVISSNCIKDLNMKPETFETTRRKSREYISRVGKR